MTTDTHTHRKLAQKESRISCFLETDIIRNTLKIKSPETIKFPPKEEEEEEEVNAFFKRVK